jgi:cysteine dioxygenase
LDHLSGLSGPPDLCELELLLGSLDVRRADLGRFVAFNDAGYARHRVAASGFYELLVVCWGPGQVSAIHDHTGTACAFKVIEGEGVETTFERTGEGLARPNSAAPLRLGQVCASFDSDVHQVCNPASDAGLITLHIYAPPLQRMRTYALDRREAGAERRMSDLVAGAARA